MSDIVNKLRRLEFPAATARALSQLGQCLLGKEAGSIPGLEDSNEDLADQLVREFVFYQVPTKAGYIKKLSAIQELQLLEALLVHFQQETDDRTRHVVFKGLFGPSLDAFRLNILYKLISMAIGVKSIELLDCAAVWMQRHGCSSDAVQQVVQNLVQDYSVLLPGVSSTLRVLPQLSTHFTCNFLTAVTVLYRPTGDGKGGQLELPLGLLETMAEWITSDPHLCLVSLGHAQNVFIQPQRSSLWTSPTKPNTQTPIPGLVRWVTQGPLLLRMQALAFNNSPSKSFSGGDQLTGKLVQSCVVWSRLHLGVLQTLQSFPTLPGANQLELLTLADMSRIVKEVVTVKQQVWPDNTAPHSAYMGVTEGTSSSDSDCLTLSVERTVQILQVALATGGFRCSLGDLQSICNSLPPCRLLAILQSQHLARTPPPMHHESR